MSSLAIIAARGGSKRIPRKNIRPFRGKPILAWPLLAALESRLFDEVMVSTDDDEIAGVATALGALVPFTRSSTTADDSATTSSVLLEVLGCYAQRGRTFEAACCLYATAVFVTPQLLTRGHVALMDGPFDVIIPVTDFAYPVWRSLRRHPDGRVEMNWPEFINSRSQDLPKVYHDAGQFYWFRTAAFLRELALMSGNIGSIDLAHSQVQDIDTEADWALAELKHAHMFP